MPNIVYIATSLDGFIARENGDLDWLMEIPNPDNNDYGFSLFMERIDGIVMGRKTLETVVSFNDWPYTKPVFVLSDSLRKAPNGYEDKVEIVNGDLAGIVESLNEKGFETLYIDGGKTIQSFLKQDLIDELIITKVSVILGSGISLFDKMESQIKLDLINTEILSKDLVKCTYVRKGS